MPLVSPETDNAYANDYRKNEVTAAIFKKLEPAISPKTRSILEPDYFEQLTRSRYQNACIYVMYEYQFRSFLLVTLNGARGIKDLSANSNIMTPGGRRDKDHGLLFTALKEMEEEAGLSCDFIKQHHPDAIVAYAGAVMIPSKRGAVSFPSQLHRYALLLGELTADQITALTQQIKAGDDVAFAEFVEVTALEDDKVNSLKVQLKGTDKNLPLLPAVCQLTKNLLRGAESLLATMTFSQIYKTISCEFETIKAQALLELFHNEPSSNKKDMLAYCLLQTTAVQDLQTIAALKTTRGEIANVILEQYCSLSMSNLNDINNKYALSKAEKGAKSSTTESKLCRENLADPSLADKERYALAQSFWLSNRNKDYAQVLAVGTRKTTALRAPNQSDDDDNSNVSTVGSSMK